MHQSTDTLILEWLQHKSNRILKITELPLHALCGKTHGSNRNDGTKEYKPFSAHEAGGTGFLICKEGQGGHPACITFLPNVSTTGKSTWRWAQSDVTPEPGRYYHVVGVWDKTAEKA